ncbi:carboxylating nicotinate-nucleotide diphosphorylase [Candidatus Bathyarchaeota archaeon]|nr:carboxylating nicotinate-nucleotide diphosphorylase [Candidatus Bathyarchaeota archaeon]RJS70269.1 MAG: carboxylating nicotinate-nucleotide diphosphorylase [Candidatus Bathyarchaeota archaeon]
MFLPRKILEEKLRSILTEDLGKGDVTTMLLIPADSTAEAEVIARESGVIAGVEEAEVLAESLGLKVENLVSDGEEVKTGKVLMKISGKTRTILAAERTILNILSRMSGIATATRKLVNKLKRRKLKTRVACTRKVAPGLLYFDKKAVLIGGGDTHRLCLDDMILIKDNHIAVVGSVEKAVKTAREKVSFSKKIEVEVTRVEDVLKAAKAGADIIMLDNFHPKQIEKAVKTLKKSGFYGKVLLEASGGITAKNILEFASTGVDVVSLGEITHSVKALNISLEITKTE